jgi:diaminohydroxyphosphoribosylaminopyrimidine deaminase/5-amino-6-(5-phosphoribosylamino)uracil reductase
MAGDESKWMLRALELAERGRGYVEPNPLVGAVLVRNGEVAGEGWHERFGQAHAEINALTSAGEAARGADLYVTLEPCCHHGKTPPCTEAIRRAGIGRINVPMLDPFPQVSGQGVAQLRQAGIEVEIGMCKTEARRLNAPYLTLVTKGRPYVHAKWAMTLDGKICTHTGDSKWISNEAARQRVHQLRGRMDAIIVGIGTVLADDPMLTARPPGPRIATRIVLDSRGRLPLESHLLQTVRDAPLMVITAEDNAEVGVLRSAGCEVMPLKGSAREPLASQLLLALGQRRMTNILVEGGAQVLGSFFDAGLVDEVWAFVAPSIIGGAGKSPVAGTGTEKIASAMSVRDWQIVEMDDNVLLHGLCTHRP